MKNLFTLILLPIITLACNQVEVTKGTPQVHRTKD